MTRPACEPAPGTRTARPRLRRTPALAADPPSHRHQHSPSFACSEYTEHTEHTSHSAETAPARAFRGACAFPDAKGPFFNRSRGRGPPRQGRRPGQRRCFRAHRSPRTRRTCRDGDPDHHGPGARGRGGHGLRGRTGPHPRRRAGHRPQAADPNARTRPWGPRSTLRTSTSTSVWPAMATAPPRPRRTGVGPVCASGSPNCRRCARGRTAGRGRGRPRRSKPRAGTPLEDAWNSIFDEGRPPRPGGRGIAPPVSV